MPHGSVPGPLFIMYTVDLADVILCNRPLLHVYADDTELYGNSSRPEDVSTLGARVISCIHVVADWMRSNLL